MRSSRLTALKQKHVLWLGRSDKQKKAYSDWNNRIWVQARPPYYHTCSSDASTWLLSLPLTACLYIGSNVDVITCLPQQSGHIYEPPRAVVADRTYVLCVISGAPLTAGCPPSLSWGVGMRVRALPPLQQLHSLLLQRGHVH